MGWFSPVLWLSSGGGIQLIVLTLRPESCLWRMQQINIKLFIILTEKWNIVHSHALVLLVMVDIMGKSICYIMLKNNSDVKFTKNLNFLIKRKDVVYLCKSQENLYAFYRVNGQNKTKQKLWYRYSYKKCELQFWHPSTARVDWFWVV